MIRYGFSWGDFIGMIITTLLCLFTKSTVASAIPLAIIALLFGLLRDKNRKYAWGILVITFLGLIAFAFKWNDAAHWQHVTTQTSTTRVDALETPFGNYALQLHLAPEKTKSTISQSIFHENMLNEIRGRKVTVGAWIWADGDQTNGTISLYDEKEQKIGRTTVTLDNKPQFFAFLSKVPEDIQLFQIALSGNRQAGSKPVNIYYDGVLVIPGDHTDGHIPECLDPECNQVAWEGLTFGNLVRNSSAEKAWPSLHPQITYLISEFIPISNPSTTLSSLLNWRVNQWYFRAVIGNFLQTFWAKFGWGHVPLLGNKPYRILTILTVIAIIGTLVRLIRLRKMMPWPSTAFLLITLFLIWGSAFMRGITSTRLLSSLTYISVARYAYPAIIPTVLILNLGWLEVSDQAHHWLKIPPKYLYGIYIAFFIGLDILSILSIYNFYYLS